MILIVLYVIAVLILGYHFGFIAGCGFFFLAGALPPPTS